MHQKQNCINLKLFMTDFVFLFLFWFKVPVNNFSVMLRRSHLFLGITSTFLGSKCFLLKETNTPTRPRIEPGSPDPKCDALTIRPVRPPVYDRDEINCKHVAIYCCCTAWSETPKTVFLATRFICHRTIVCI